MKVKIEKIKPNPDNPRSISKKKFELLKKSITEFPEMLKLAPIVVDENMVTLSGNMRLKALLDLGHETVDVIQAKDLTPEQKAEFLIKSNSHAGEWDFDMIANGNWEIDTLKGWGMEIPGFGKDAVTFQASKKPILKVICESEDDKRALSDRLKGEGYAIK